MLRTVILLKIAFRILLSFVRPVKAFYDPDDTRYRSKIKGVYSSNGDIQPWSEVIADIKDAMASVKVSKVNSFSLN